MGRDPCGTEERETRRRKSGGLPAIYRHEEAQLRTCPKGGKKQRLHAEEARGSQEN